MDLRNLTGKTIDNTALDNKAVKSAIASSNQLPGQQHMQPHQLKALQAFLQQQQLGKVFDVVVNKVEGNTVLLNIPGLPDDSPLLKAELANPPVVGTRLTLQLTDESNKPQLKVIATPNSPQDVVSRQLRTTLQQQQPLTPLLANLSQIAKSAVRLPVALPQDVIDAVTQVVQQLPKSTHINQAEGLKQAIKNSGPFLEHALAKKELTIGIRPDPIQADVIKNLPRGIHPATNQVSAHAILHDKAAKVEEHHELERRAFERMSYSETTIQQLNAFFNAMRQQPMLDVRANLLRLASLLKTMNEQVQLNAQQVPATTEQKAELIDKSAKPSLSGLTQVPAKPVTTQTGTTSQTQTAAQSYQAAQPNTPQPSMAVRSQTPQAQTQLIPSINTLMTQESMLEELIGQIETSLSRIQVQQLQTLATEQQHRPTWVIELPVRTDQGIDLFDLRIGRDSEQHQPGDPKAPWVITLAFDLGGLGPVHARITLYGEDQISTSIWAEKPETSTYFNQHMDKLKARLIKAGLDVKRLNCQSGKPNAPPPSDEPRLVDEKV